LRFGVNPELYEVFGEEEIRCHEFLESQKLSTYLYSIMAGPYDMIVDETQNDIP